MSIYSEYYYTDNNVTPFVILKITYIWTKSIIYLFLFFSNKENFMWSIQTGRLTTGLEELTAHCHLHGPLDIDFFFFFISYLHELVLIIKLLNLYISYFGCRFLIFYLTYYVHIYIYGYCCLTGLCVCREHGPYTINYQAGDWIYIHKIYFVLSIVWKSLTCFGYFRWVIKLLRVP